MENDIVRSLGETLFARQRRKGEAVEDLPVADRDEYDMQKVRIMEICDDAVERGNISDGAYGIGNFKDSEDIEESMVFLKQPLYDYLLCLKNLKKATQDRDIVELDKAIEEAANILGEIELVSEARSLREK